MANNEAIQILRTEKITDTNKVIELLDGQPFYNKQKNYLTVGHSTNGTIQQEPVTVRELVGYFDDYVWNAGTQTHDLKIGSSTDSNQKYYVGPLKSYNGTGVDLLAIQSNNIWLNGSVRVASHIDFGENLNENVDYGARIVFTPNGETNNPASDSSTPNLGNAVGTLYIDANERYYNSAGSVLTEPGNLVMSGGNINMSGGNLVMSGINSIQLSSGEASATDKITLTLRKFLNSKFSGVDGEDGGTEQSVVTELTGNYINLPHIQTATRVTNHISDPDGDEYDPEAARTNEQLCKRPLWVSGAVGGYFDEDDNPDGIMENGVVRGMPHVTDVDDMHFVAGSAHGYLFSRQLNSNRIEVTRGNDEVIIEPTDITLSDAIGNVEVVINPKKIKLDSTTEDVDVTIDLEGIKLTNVDVDNETEAEVTVTPTGIQLINTIEDATAEVTINRTGITTNGAITAGPSDPGDEIHDFYITSTCSMQVGHKLKAGLADVNYIELNGYGTTGGFADFHYPGGDDDYSMRIMCSGRNALTISSKSSDLETDAILLECDEGLARVTASTFCARSDKRLKENIIPYESEKSILDLPVYKYNFINDSTKTTQIGCLAQDLQEICPELVQENTDGYLSINEGKIVYLLLEEVKKLKKEIQELKDLI